MRQDQREFKRLAWQKRIEVYKLKQLLKDSNLTEEDKKRLFEMRDKADKLDV